MTVYAFGDSHTTCAVHGGAISAYAGPVTLHRLGRPGEAVELMRRFWRGGEAIMVIAGEIDARTHIGRQIELGRDPSEVILTLASGAAYAQQALEEEFDCTVVQVLVIGATSEIEGGDPDWPFTGTLRDRQQWVDELNERLEQLCRTVDPYHTFMAPDGTLPPDNSDGGVHLHPRFGPQAFGPIIQRLK